MIFPWIWSFLPGKKLTKLGLALTILALIVLALFVWVFPAIDIYINPAPTLGAVETLSTFVDF
jgi:hypothetical protein